MNDTNDVPVHDIEDDGTTLEEAAEQAADSIPDETESAE